MDCGLRTADCGLRIADCGLRTADCGLGVKRGLGIKCRLQTEYKTRRYKTRTTDYIYKNSFRKVKLRETESCSRSLFPPRTRKVMPVSTQGSLNFIRLLRVVITPSVTSLLRGENDSKQSDEFQAILKVTEINLVIL